MSELIDKVKKEHIWNDGGCSCGWSAYQHTTMTHLDHKLEALEEAVKVETFNGVFAALNKQVLADLPGLSEPEPEPEPVLPPIGRVYAVNIHPDIDDIEYVTHIGKNHWLDTNGVSYSWGEIEQFEPSLVSEGAV